MSPCSMYHIHVSLLSGHVQSIMPCHKLIIKSDRLSAPKCIMSDPADLGSPSVKRGSRPENIDGLDIPVLRHRRRYCDSLGDKTR
jgi:hypothetical protein